MYVSHHSGSAECALRQKSALFTNAYGCVLNLTPQPSGREHLLTLCSLLLPAELSQDHTGYPNYIVPAESWDGQCLISIPSFP